MLNHSPAINSEAKLTPKLKKIGKNTAVSYQIRRLEETLDCALFQRSVRQVYLTPAGQQLLQTTQRSFAALDDTFKRIKPGDSDHDVLIGATTYVALRWLSPRISGFNQRRAHAP